MSKTSSSSQEAATIQKITILGQEVLSKYSKSKANIPLLFAHVKDKNDKINHTAKATLSQIFIKLNITELKNENKKLQDILFEDLMGDGMSQLHSLSILLTHLKQTSKILSLQKKEFIFPNQQYSKILKTIVKSLTESNIEQLKVTWIGLLDMYTDLRVFWYKFVGGFIAESYASHKIQVEFLLDVLLKLDVKFEDEDGLLYCSDDEITASPVSTASNQQTIFTACWLQTLRSPLPQLMYKKILTILHKKILPHLDDPCLLIDFLTDAYDSGDATMGVLALNGLFLLISEYNLDYPNFYKKLYTLLTPSLLHTPQRSRFFRLVNLFLSSSYLPASLVSAFIKRLGRLSLSATPGGVLIIVPLIYNLLRGNPSCLRLIHVGGGGEPGMNDPYNFHEQDPEKSNANSSYLWEVVMLQTHYLPSVSGLNKIFEEALTRGNYDLEDFLDCGYDKLLDMNFGQESAVDFGGKIF